MTCLTLQTSESPWLTWVDMEFLSSDIALALAIMEKHAVQAEGLLKLVTDYEFDDARQMVKIELPGWINELAAEFYALYREDYLPILEGVILHILRNHFNQSWPKEQAQLMSAILRACYAQSPPRVH